MSRWLYLCCITGALLLGATVPVLGAGEEDAQASWERYEVLVSRNMFSRRRSRAVPGAAATVREAPPPPERSVILWGVARNGEGYTAFFEDARTGTVTTVGQGDALLKGLIKEITLDGVEYEKDDQTVVVGVGRNLEGGGSTALRSRPGGATSGGASAASGPADVLERLRQRRERELGR